MKFFRLDLLTLLISLFILNSCKNEDTVGLAINSANQLSGSLLDTATIFTNTTTDDTVATSELAKTPFGFFTDPVLGTSEADLVTDLHLPGSAAYTVPVGTVNIDSAVLILKYADGFYGDSISSKYTADVYQLGERVYNTTYYSNKKWDVNPTLIGTKSFYARPRDSIKIYDIVSGGPDTLIKVPPQVRIPINTSFLQTALFKAGTEQLGSDLIFDNNVKGLFVTIDKSKTIGAGGIFMLQAPADSSLAIYIRATNGSVIDTSVVYLDVSEYAAQISHSYSTQVANAIARTAANTANHTNLSDSIVYMQGLASLRTKISFPYIQNLFKSLGGINNVIINRAEIVLTVDPGSDIPSYLVPVPKLTMYRYDIAHQITYVEDASGSAATFLGVGQFGGFYNLPTKNYHFLVTTYIQDLLRGNTIDYGTYIAPVDTTNTASVDIAPTPQVAARTIAVGNNESSPYSIKLNVIYTKVNSKQ